MQRVITTLIAISLAQFVSAKEVEAIGKMLETRSPHPTQLTVKYKDQRYPVIRMKKWDPLIMVDSREKRLRSERDYMPRRATAYGPERVELKKVEYGGMQQLRVETHGKPMMGSHPGIGEFKGIFKSRRTLKDAFITIVIYTPHMFLSPEHYAYYPYYSIFVLAKELPDLPAGKEVSVRFTTKMPAVFPDQRYFVQVFDGNGHEAKTNVMQNGWPYFALTERKLLKEAMVRYKERFVDQDNAVTPIVMMNPLLPENITPPETPITATFTVSVEGLTKDISIKNANEESLNQAVREAVQGWLFLPRLVSGEPVESLVEVPIQF